MCASLQALKSILNTLYCQLKAQASVLAALWGKAPGDQPQTKGGVINFPNRG